MAKDKDLHPIHPGEILREELLKTYQLTAEQLAQSIQVENKIVERILNEKQGITPELSYRLGCYWGIREDYWLDLQKHYELECWKEQQELSRIQKQIKSYPRKETAANY